MSVLSRIHKFTMRNCWRQTASRLDVIPVVVIMIRVFRRQNPTIIKVAPHLRTYDDKEERTADVTKAFFAIKLHVCKQKLKYSKFIEDLKQGHKVFHL